MGIIPKIPKMSGWNLAAVIGTAAVGFGLYMGWTLAKGTLRTIDQYGGWIPDQFINSSPYDAGSNVTYYFADEDFRIMLA